MGYRSEIGILITCPKRVSGDKIISRMKKAWNTENGDDLEKDFSITEVLDGKHRYVGFHCDWIKWYESFDCVRKVMDYIGTWDENYKSGGVHFVRIGESLGDIDEMCFGDPESYIDVWSSMSVTGGI